MSEAAMNHRSPVRPFPVRLAFALLWLFVFSMPIEKSIEIPGLGTITKVVGLLAMASGLIAVVYEGRLRLPSPIHIILGIFVCWSALTLVWSLSPETTEAQIVTSVQLWCLLWLVWQLCSDEKHVLSLMEAYVFGTIVPAVQVAQRFLIGAQAGYNRFSIERFDPNDLALTLALSLPMSYYLTLRLNATRKWICRVQIMAAMAAIFLTGSRGGTLAMATGLSIVVWTFPALSRRDRMTTGTVFALAAVLAISFVPATSWKRLATLGSEVSEGTLNGRTTIWKAGWEAFTNAPFEGIGAGSYPETTVEVLGRPWGFVPVAHNSFLSILVETGLIGFAIFATAVTLALFSALRLPGISGWFWSTLLTAWAIGVFSLTWEYRKPTWLLFGLLTAHAATLLRHETSTEHQSSELSPAYRCTER